MAAGNAKCQRLLLLLMPLVASLKSSAR